MHYIATFQHSPEHCWAREENASKARSVIPELEHRAESHGVTLHGAYAAPNEHTLFLIVESDSFAAVSRFLGSPILEDHEGEITPVLTMDETMDAVIEG
jgi:hypothetical protein